LQAFCRWLTQRERVSVLPLLLQPPLLELERARLQAPWGVVQKIFITPCAGVVIFI
jgi:hypothetical protein